MSSIFSGDVFSCILHYLIFLLKSSSFGIFVFSWWSLTYSCSTVSYIIFYLLRSVLLKFLSYFQLKAEETSGIMRDFDEPGHLAPTGLYLGGVKYMVIQGEPGIVIRGKKVISPLFNLFSNSNF